MVENSSESLVELAERVEKAEGADSASAEMRTLNSEVLRAFGWRQEERDIIDPDGYVRLQVPYLVGSIDAATALFPPNTMIRSGHSALAPDPSMFFCDAVTEDGRDFHALALTEANARVAAALRARSAALS